MLHRKYILFVLLGFLLFLAVSVNLPIPAISDQPTSSSTLPMTEYNGAMVPDWSEISFDTFGGMSDSGTFVAPPELTSAIGFDSSVSWTKGTPIASVIRIGFLETAYGLGKLSLAEISKFTGLNTKSLPLKDFGLLNWQTLGSLVQAVPGLADLPVSAVPAIADLVGGFGSGETIGSLASNPQYANLALTPILDSFKIGDIPGLDSTGLSGFQNWKEAFISDIPGLSDLPFADFPIPPSTKGSVALFNVPLSGDGKFISNTISGSDVEGFSVDCNQSDCPNIELGKPFLGNRWIVGDISVKGGHNLLASINNNEEPTGRLFTGSSNPETEPFKLILNKLETDAPGTATFGLAMHWCFHHVWPDPLPNPDCTPYFIEFPGLFTWHEKDIIYIGAGK